MIQFGISPNKLNKFYINVQFIMQFTGQSKPIG